MCTVGSSERKKSTRRRMDLDCNRDDSGILMKSNLIPECMNVWMNEMSGKISFGNNNDGIHTQIEPASWSIHDLHAIQYSSNIQMDFSRSISIGYKRRPTTHIVRLHSTQFYSFFLHSCQHSPTSGDHSKRCDFRWIDKFIFFENTPLLLPFRACLTAIHIYFGANITHLKPIVLCREQKFDRHKFDLNSVCLLFIYYFDLIKTHAWSRICLWWECT